MTQRGPPRNELSIQQQAPFESTSSTLCVQSETLEPGDQEELAREILVLEASGGPAFGVVVRDREKPAEATHPGLFTARRKILSGGRSNLR